jgi:hypothetical protein
MYLNTTVYYTVVTMKKPKNAWAKREHTSEIGTAMMLS